MSLLADVEEERLVGVGCAKPLETLYGLLACSELT